MSRMILRAAVVLTLVGLTGCVAVSAKGNRFGPDSELVSNNGHVYLVDKSCGKAWEIDISNAERFDPAVHGKSQQSQQSD